MAETAVAKTLGQSRFGRVRHGRRPKKGKWLARWSPSLDVLVPVLAEDIVQMNTGIPFALVTGTMPRFTVHGRLMPRVSLPVLPSRSDVSATETLPGNAAIDFADDEIGLIRTASGFASNPEGVGRVAAFNRVMGYPLLQPLPSGLCIREPYGDSETPLPQYPGDTLADIVLLISGTFPNYVARGWTARSKARKYQDGSDVSI
jgi:hypothetical protein